VQAFNSTSFGAGCANRIRFSSSGKGGIGVRASVFIVSTDTRVTAPAAFHSALKALAFAAQAAVMASHSRNGASDEFAAAYLRAAPVPRLPARSCVSPS
jgi:hypothetical protein